jgi:hypothetical protein
MRGEGWGGCGVSANEYSCTQEPKINLGFLTPYLTYVLCIDPKLAAGGSVVRISAARLLNTFSGDSAHISISLMARIYFYLFILSVTSAGPYRT